MFYKKRSRKKVICPLEKGDPYADNWRMLIVYWPDKLCLYQVNLSILKNVTLAASKHALPIIIYYMANRILELHLRFPQVWYHIQITTLSSKQTILCPSDSYSKHILVPINRLIRTWSLDILEEIRYYEKRKHR